MSDTYLI